MPRQRMGEIAAPDRYGVMMKFLPQRLSKDPAVDRALRLAGPGYEEGETTLGNRFPDALENQRPPPAPPFFDDNTPDWATAPGETPDYLIRDPMRDPEDDSA
jgi:hypothetical protein